MKATLKQGNFPLFCNGRAGKKTSYPSNNTFLSQTSGVTNINNGRKDSCLAAHYENLLSPVMQCRRRKAPAVNCQHSSDCSIDGYQVPEKFIQTNNQPGSFNGSHPVVGTKESPSVRNELMVLALPAIVGQAIDPLAQLMETAYIGRLGLVELASAGVSVSIFNIISKLFNVPLLSITTSFVAEDISKTASEDAGRLKLPSVSSALLLAAAIGCFEALALYFGAGLSLSLMGVSVASPMHNPACLFLSLRAIGAPAFVISLAVQGVFRGFKDTKTPLFCVGIGNLSAVILLPVFIYCFHLGIAGAAVATVISQYITTFLLIWFLSKRAVLLPPKLSDLQFGGYIKSGGLLLGRTLSVLVTMTLGTAMAARQGPVAMAAHQICLQVWLAVSLLSDALALSAQALIASSFAKRDYNKVKEVTYFVLKAGLCIGIVLSIILFVLFGNLVNLFTKDAGVLQIVKTGVLFVSASQPINALAFIFDGLHYGVSDFAYSAWSMMTVGAMSSIFLLYAPSKIGLAGVWAGLTLFMSLRMIAGFFRLNWKAGPWWFLHQEVSNFELLPTSDSASLIEPGKANVSYATE